MHCAFSIVYSLTLLPCALILDSRLSTIMHLSPPIGMRLLLVTEVVRCTVLMLHYRCVCAYWTEFGPWHSMLLSHVFWVGVLGKQASINMTLLILITAWPLNSDFVPGLLTRWAGRGHTFRLRPLNSEPVHGCMDTVRPADCSYGHFTRIIDTALCHGVCCFCTKMCTHVVLFVCLRRWQITRLCSRCLIGSTGRLCDLLSFDDLLGVVAGC